MTLHGPDLHLLNALQTTAQRGPACAAGRRKRRKKESIKRRPKNENMARRKSPRANLRTPTCQRVRDQSLQKEGPESHVL